MHLNYCHMRDFQIKWLVFNCHHSIIGLQTVILSFANLLLTRNLIPYHRCHCLFWNAAFFTAAQLNSVTRRRVIPFYHLQLGAGGDWQITSLVAIATDDF